MREEIINQLQTEYEILKEDLISNIPVRFNEGQSNLTIMGNF